MLVTALNNIRQCWIPLGVYLGLSDSNLKNIYLLRNQMGNDDKTRVREMLEMWLKSPEINKRNKQFLQRAVQRLTPHPVLSLSTSGE